MGLLTFLMWAINITFWVIGGVMLGVGIWMAVDPDAGQNLSLFSEFGIDDSLYWAAVYTMIGVGAAVFVVGFLGCAGAKGNKLFLKIYFVLVKIIILFQIISIILVAVFWDSLGDNVRDTMYQDVTQKYYNETDLSADSVTFNKIQVEWKCCGASNYMDYRSSNYTIHAGESVPWTCCVMKEDRVGDTLVNVLNVTECRIEADLPITSASHYHYLYPTGCYYALTDFIDENAGIIIGITCGFICLQLLGSILACLLMKRGSD